MLLLLKTVEKIYSHCSFAICSSHFDITFLFDIKLNLIQLVIDKYSEIAGTLLFYWRLDLYSIPNYKFICVINDA